MRDAFWWFKFAYNTKLIHSQSWFFREKKTDMAFFANTSWILPVEFNLLTLTEGMATGTGYRSWSWPLLLLLWIRRHVRHTVCLLSWPSTYHIWGPDMYKLKVCVWVCAFIMLLSFLPFGPQSCAHLLKLLVVHSCKSYRFSSSSFLRGSIRVQDNACEHTAEIREQGPSYPFFFPFFWRRGCHNKKHWLVACALYI